LSGPKAFLRSVVNRKEEPIKINLTNAKAGLVTYRFFSDNIQVPLGVKVLSINPTALVVKLEPMKKKEVPLKLTTKGALSVGSKLTKMELLTPTVLIKGAESKVEQITEAYTLPFDLSKVESSGDRELFVDLSKMPGVFVDSENPKVHFEIEQPSSNFKIRNADLKILSDLKHQTDYKEATIYVSCTPDALKSLDRSKVFAFADLKGKPAGTYTINLNAELPSNIKLIKIQPSKITVKLQ
jgi:YbbR domain-containing protein